MTNPGEDAAATPSSRSGSDSDAGAGSGSGSGSEPTAAGYEAPPIEQAAGQSPTFPDYTPPPAYGQPEPTAPPQGYPHPGNTAPDYSATGYPPPPPGYGAPQDTGYPPPGYGADPGAAYPPPGYGGPGYPPPQPGYGAPPPFPPQFGAPPPYGAPGYPPPYGGPAVAPQNNSAIASLVCSGLSIPLFFFCFFGGPPAAIAGIVLGIVALNQIKRTGQRGKELAISGIVLGGLLLVLGIALGVLLFGIASVSP
ncbi:DUF4190 domain-containing protein [Mycolicibacterium bacteremicum]|uniref:DUF4190 domain-containing protein n=1 Tax=Mycolicibacterium bacteremicum TaxID=564198 RepID=UPI0026F37823|nr:DUF4190 domain-containing protein [Mycolicibacterium bacteremicum]